MPEVPGRPGKESRIARILARIFGLQRNQILELLGADVVLDNVTEEFWGRQNEELAGSFAFAEEEYLEAAERVLAAQPIGVDWGLVNSGASQWAQGYTFDLVRGINNTSREALRRAIGNFFEQQQTISQLRNRLTSIFGPVRAELIASTELTRASVQGELAVVQEIQNQGVQMQARWITSRDEIVCPICSPLDGRVQGDGWTDPPPAHPRCRCWLSHEFVQ